MIFMPGPQTPLTGTGGGALSTSCNAVSSPCDAAGYVYLQSSTTDTAYGFAMTRADPMLGCASMLVARPARSTTAKVVAVLQPLFPAATAVVSAGFGFMATHRYLSCLLHLTGKSLC